jgi:hypothetical protein
MRNRILLLTTNLKDVEEKKNLTAIIKMYRDQLYKLQIIIFLNHGHLQLIERNKIIKLLEYRYLHLVEDKNLGPFT